MLAQKLYDTVTWIWHKVFRVPIRLKTAYKRRTKQPRLTVVFLHGISATSDTWRTTLKQLSKEPELAEVDFIALDLLGFGKSLHASWLDYDYLDYDSALDQALKHLHIKTPVILIGHSMGSLIAADYATNFQQPSVELAELVLVSPPVLMAEELARLPDKAYTKTYGSLHKIATEVPAAEVLAHLVQRFSSFRSAYIRTPAFAKSMEQVILNPKNYHTYTKIHIPTAVIHGHFDPLVMPSNLKRAARQNPRLRYISVIGQHDISVGKRAKILAEIKKVLKNANQT